MNASFWKKKQRCFVSHIVAIGGQFVQKKQYNEKFRADPPELCSLETADEKLWYIFFPSLIKRYTLVFCHGAGYGIEFRYLEYKKASQLLNPLGIQLLVCEYCGFGKRFKTSQSNECTLFIQYPKNVSMILAHLKIAWQDVILAGHSFGAPIAAHIARQHPQVQSLIMTNPLWSSKEIVRNSISKYLAAVTIECLSVIPLVWKQIKCPIIILQSKDDRTCKLDDCKAYIQQHLLQHTYKLIVIDGDHMDIPLERMITIIFQTDDEKNQNQQQDQIIKSEIKKTM